MHGFTAPIFLFSSGMAFGITTLGKWQDHTRLGNPVYKRFERYAILIGIGYFMHFHQLSLSWVMGLSDERLATVTRIDALQHIGVALLLAEGLALLLRRKGPFLATITVLAISAVGLAPFVWSLSTEGLPIPIAAWVNAQTGSIFPFVPWCGFLFAGILTARFVQSRRKKAQGLMQLVVPLGLIAGALIFFGDYMAHAELDLFPEHNFWKTSPWFFCIRLGGVLGVLSVLCLLELVLQKRSADKGPVVRFIQIAGQQTLVLYVAHLMLLYGTGVTPGFNNGFHRALDLGPALALVALFFVAMGLLAYVWHWTKKHHFRAFEMVRYSVTALVVVIFLLT